MLRVRLTTDEQKRLQAYADAESITVSEYVRRLIERDRVNRAEGVKHARDRWTALYEAHWEYQRNLPLDRKAPLPDPSAIASEIARVEDLARRYDERAVERELEAYRRAFDVLRSDASGMTRGDAGRRCHRGFEALQDAFGKWMRRMDRLTAK